MTYQKNSAIFSFPLLLIIALAFLLRVPFLDRYPPSLYSDEVSQGYNAYSILKTGKDEYGTFLPVALRSFGDWKPPLQTYLMIPTISIFGLNAWGVRLPSALLGTATVLLVYAITKSLISTLSLPKSALRTYAHWFGLCAGLWLAISPWHILESRAAMLVGISLFFLCVSIWLFLKGLDNPRYFIASGIFFGLTLYGYYGMRLVVPLVLTLLCIFFAQDLLRNKQKALLGICALGIVFVPLLVNFWNEPNVLLGRVKTVSVFYDQGLMARDTERMKEDGTKMSIPLANFLHATSFSYFIDIERRFLEHVSGAFLFLVGDRSQPFQIPNMGVLYWADLPFLLLGIYYLAKEEKRLSLFLLLLGVISIMPGALTYVTPSANRTFTLLLPLSLIISVGLWQAIRQFKHPQLLKCAIIGGYVLCGMYFIRQYVLSLPYDHADWWHGGYQELFTYLKSQENDYAQITITGKASVPYIFYLFYNQIDPHSIKSHIRRNYRSDEFGFEHVDSFDMYEFPRRNGWNIAKESLPAHSLVVLSGTEPILANTQELKTIYYPNQKTAFKIYATQVIK